MVLPEKIKVQFSNDEARAFVQVINAGIQRLNYDDRRCREKIMTMSLLNELNLRLQTATIRSRPKYTIGLSLAQAQAVVLAYEKGYIYANNEDPWTGLVLQSKFNLLHQKTV